MYYRKLLEAEPLSRGTQWRSIYVSLVMTNLQCEFIDNTHLAKAWPSFMSFFLLHQQLCEDPMVSIRQYLDHLEYLDIDTHNVLPQGSTVLEMS